MFIAEGTSSGFGAVNFLPILAMVGIFYFLLIRPQRQQQKRQEEMRNSLSKNDKVVTLGGIHGIITGITDRTVTVKVDDGVSIKFDRSAVSQVLTEKSKSETSSGSDDDSKESK